MSDPYDPTLPPPESPAPGESGARRGPLARVRHGAFTVAPVAALVMVVGLIAAIFYQADHAMGGSDPGQRATVSTEHLPDVDSVAAS